MPPFVSDLRYLLPWQFSPTVFLISVIGVALSIYAACGRAWDLSPMDDQQLGGLLTWIPAAMMSLVCFAAPIGDAANRSGALA